MRHDTEPGLQTHCVLILFLLQSHPTDRSRCGHDMVTEGVTKLCENPLRFFLSCQSIYQHAACRQNIFSARSPDGSRDAMLRKVIA